MQTFKRLLPTILMLIFEIVVGVMLILNGEGLTKVIFYIFGGLTLVGGIVTLIATLLSGRNGRTIQTLPLVASLIMIAVGGFFLGATDFVLQVVSAMTVVLGLIMAANGIFKFFEYFYIKKLVPVSPMALVSAIVSVIVGLVIAFNPFQATETMWIILGIMVIVAAVFDLISLIFLGSAVKNIKDYSE